MPKRTETATTAERDQEWISMRAAVHLIAPQLGDDRRAKRAILERLRDGAVKARAWWMAYGVDKGQPYKEPVIKIEWEEGESPPPEPDWQLMRRVASKPIQAVDRFGSGFALDVRTSPMLGGGFWSRVTPRDVQRWNWSSGFCISSALERVQLSAQNGALGFKQLPMRTFALGVELLRSDVLKISPVHLTKARSKAGRPPSTRTAPWVTELLLLFDTELLEEWPAERVVNTIADRLAEKGEEELAHSAAHAIASRVISDLRDRSKERSREYP